MDREGRLIRYNTYTQKRCDRILGKNLNVEDWPRPTLIIKTYILRIIYEGYHFSRQSIRLSCFTRYFHLFSNLEYPLNLNFVLNVDNYSSIVKTSQRSGLHRQVIHLRRQTIHINGTIAIATQIIPNDIRDSKEE